MNVTTFVKLLWTNPLYKAPLLTHFELVYLNNPPITFDETLHIYIPILVQSGCIISFSNSR